MRIKAMDVSLRLSHERLEVAQLLSCHVFMTPQWMVFVVFQKRSDLKPWPANRSVAEERAVRKQCQSDMKNGSWNDYTERTLRSNIPWWIQWNDYWLRQWIYVRLFFISLAQSICTKIIIVMVIAATSKYVHSMKWLTCVTKQEIYRYRCTVYEAMDIHRWHIVHFISRCIEIWFFALLCSANWSMFTSHHVHRQLISRQSWNAIQALSQSHSCLPCNLGMSYKSRHA